MPNAFTLHQMHVWVSTSIRRIDGGHGQQVAEKMQEDETQVGLGGCGEHAVRVT